MKFKFTKPKPKPVVSIRLPQEVLDWIDSQSKNRSAFIEQCLKHIKTASKVVVLLLPLACAKPSDNSDAGSCGAKSLFSQWTHSENGLGLNFTSLKLGTTMTARFSSPDYGACLGKINLTGNECGGTYKTSEWAYQSGTGKDPGCSGMNGEGLYSKAPDGLRFRSSTSFNHSFWR